MSQPFLAGVILFAGNFAPKQWALCNGQIIAINQNTALFSLLGTTYGGNGVSNFALPDLRGRVAAGQGQGPGLPNVVLGEQTGEPTHTLVTTEIPSHLHTVSPGGNNTDSNPNAVKSPENAYPGYSDAAPLYASAANTTMAASNTGIGGGSLPHNNMQPYLGLNYIICMAGIFPPRN